MQRAVIIPRQCVGSERRPGGRPAEMLGAGGERGRAGTQEVDGGGGGSGGGNRMIVEGELEVGESLGRGGQGSGERTSVAEMLRAATESRRGVSRVVRMDTVAVRRGARGGREPGRGGMQ